MYVVFAAKYKEFLKLQKSSQKDQNGYKESYNEKVQIPSLENGELSVFIGKATAPSFIYYAIKNPLWIYHHLFIGA